MTNPPPQEISTYFAPAERASQEELDRQTALVAGSALIRAIQESIDGYLMILNPQRQVLAVNRRLMEDLGISAPDCLVGERPGEILGCIHATIGPGGCGTSRACATCGAVISILNSQNGGQPFTGECLASVRREQHTESLEFRVRATPVRVGEHEFTVLVFSDISGDKRRQALERVFFHDILNTIGGLQGWSQILAQGQGEDAKKIADRIVFLSQRLTREVRDQRKLTQAESGTLDVLFEPTPVREILQSLRLIFEAHDSAKDKQLEIEEVSSEEWINTDSSLLTRVLTNMVKNALEASLPGETVSVGYKGGEAPNFSIHNDGKIPEEVALRIFQRSFSTKGGSGRGIGTYSMKLFGERYLKGKVGFKTDEESGTTFFIQLPTDPNAS